MQVPQDRPRLATLAAALFAVASPVVAHDVPGTRPFVAPLPTFPFNSSIVHVTLVPPPVGESIVHATLNLVWSSNGVFPASELLLHYTLSVDGVPHDLVVTGADLGWHSGPGTYTASLPTDVFNGQISQGSIIGALFELDIATSTGTGGVTGRFLAGSELSFELSRSFRNQNEEFDISLSNGGTQLFTLDAPKQQAGRLYWILGSMSGTTPGVPGPGMTLPLNVDPYFNFTLKKPNLHIKPSAGFLNANGDGAATLTIPAGADRDLAGTVLHHAYAVFDFPGTGETTFVSNPLVLNLVP